MNPIEKQKWEQFLRDRDDATRTWLIEHYTPLVGRVVARFRNVRAADREDLFGAGAYGLVRAVDQYDPERMEWERFAKFRIHAAMVDSIRELDFAGKNIRTRARKLEDAAEELQQRLGRSGSDQELADELGVDLDQLYNLRSRLYGTGWRVDSIDSRRDEHGDDAGAWVDAIPDREGRTPEQETLFAERSAMLRDLVERLPEKEARVVRGLYFEGRRAIDLAEELGVHPSRVSQLESAALARLKALAHQQPLQLQVEEVAA